MSEPTFTEADRERVEQAMYALPRDIPGEREAEAISRLLASHDSLQAELELLSEVAYLSNEREKALEAERDSLQAEVVELLTFANEKEHEYAKRVAMVEARSEALAEAVREWTEALSEGHRIPGQRFKIVAALTTYNEATQEEE